MNTIKTFLVMMLFLLGPTGLTWGSELPPYYPSTFDKTGVIDRIDINTAEIVINDSLLFIAMNIKVHSLVTEHSSLRALREKMKIGYTYTRSKNNTRQVTELWVLPNNYSSPQ